MSVYFVPTSTSTSASTQTQTTTTTTKSQSQPARNNSHRRRNLPSASSRRRRRRRSRADEQVPGERICAQRSAFAQRITAERALLPRMAKEQTLTQAKPVRVAAAATADSRPGARTHKRPVACRCVVSLVGPLGFVGATLASCNLRDTTTPRRRQANGNKCPPKLPGCERVGQPMVSAHLHLTCATLR